jgi:carboxyl-terminal processing protease
MKKYLLFLLCAGLAFSSCKKDKKNEEGGIQETLYDFAKEVYLWNDALPSKEQFNPRQYTGSSELAALQNEINAFSQLKINPSTKRPYEYDPDFPGTAKYSYIDKGEAATSIGGTGGDFGFALSYISLSDLRLRYVFPNSSAAAQGLARGYRVTAVNDQSVTLTTGQSNDPVYNTLSRALEANSVKLNGVKPDGSTFSVTVTKTSYTINPVIKALTLTTATGKKVGYFSFSRFTVPSNSQGPINAAFAKFAADNIEELVIDLRYNGGGAVETAQNLCNYLVPAAKNNTLMFTETYNANLQAGNHPFLSGRFTVEQGFFSKAKNTYNFSKVGNLELKRVIFLVTDRTASASELVINNLKPVLPLGVKLIGTTTYGKPVGFFGIPIDGYDIYLSEFESQNAEGKADFYQGMIPGGNFDGAEVLNDDVTRDFGDPQEGMLKVALNYIDKGTYTVASVGTRSTGGAEKQNLDKINRKLDSNPEFTGAVHTSDLKRLHH